VSTLLTALALVLVGAVAAADAGRLSGSARYDAYGKRALDIETNAAPMAAYATRNNRFLVSSRTGCVGVAAHGLDLAGLCIK